MSESTRDKLRAFAKEHGLRKDWHEPDESEVSAVVKGLKLDNAFGDHGGEIGGRSPYEKLVILKVEGKEVLRVNLATVLALACQSKIDI